MRFVRSARTDGQRCCTFGFTPGAALDDERGVWPTSHAISGISQDVTDTTTALLTGTGGSRSEG